MRKAKPEELEVLKTVRAAAIMADLYIGKSFVMHDKVEGVWRCFIHLASMPLSPGADHEYVGSDDIVEFESMAMDAIVKLKRKHP